MILFGNELADLDEEIREAEYRLRDLKLRRERCRKESIKWRKIIAEVRKRKHAGDCPMEGPAPD